MVMEARDPVHGPVSEDLWEAFQLVLEAEEAAKIGGPENVEPLEDQLAMVRQALDRALVKLGIPFPG